MTWFKVDDDFWSHPKVVSLPPAAGWLWTRAGSYCGRHLTDGYVSHAAMRMLAGDEGDADALVAAGLWLAVDGGYQFHDWDTYQPTRESVMAERADAAARKRKSRRRASDGRYESQRDAQEESQEESRVTPGVTHADVTSTPNPNPNPKTTPRPIQSGPVGDRASGDDKTDLNLPAIVVDLRSWLDIDATDADAQAWAEYVLAHASGTVRDPTAYVLSSLYNSQAEVTAWVTRHHRHLRAVSNA